MVERSLMSGRLGLRKKRGKTSENHDSIYTNIGVTFHTLLMCDI